MKSPPRSACRSRAGARSLLLRVGARSTLAVANFSEAPTSSASSSVTERLSPSGVSQLRLTAQRDDQRLDLWYQTTPRAFAASSRYTQVLRQHGFTQLIGLRPDMILRQAIHGRERWLLVEVKLYGHVQDGARAALQNLLAYRRAFDTHLAGGDGIYGLGIAWGADLQPKPAEIMLCTPDTIPAAIKHFAG